MPSYNARTHPLPFMKASNVVAPAKSAKVAPDLEEAFEEEVAEELYSEFPISIGRRVAF